MCCITEVLHTSMKEVNNTAALLNVERLSGECDDTWRTRVAYAMQRHVMKCEGREPSARLQERWESWNQKAMVEHQLHEVAMRG